MHTVCRFGLASLPALVAVLALSAGAVAAPAAPAKAPAKYKNTILYDFSGADGYFPDSLISDGAGNFYGTTSGGGAHTQGDGSGGVVFALTKNGSGYDFSVLYNFCAEANCADGNTPTGALIMDTRGDLYGTTYKGGNFGGGTAYELVPERHNRWKFVTLYNFCKKAGCKDGQAGQGGLTYQGAETGAFYDGTSPLYGVTASGGNSFSAGVIYRLNSIAGKQNRSEDVLYTMCNKGQKNGVCRDGDIPSGAPIIDGNGVLYGVTLQGGGDFNTGVAYALSFNATKNKWKKKILYAFCANGNNCPDGTQPLGTQVMNSAGSLFGVTQKGGDFANGIVYRIDPGNPSQEAVLYSFCPDETVCADGSLPDTGLLLDANGNLFGAAQSGGLGFDDGVVFELSGGTETVLYEFCKLANCADGRVPQGNILMDSSGNIFGVTQTGGNSTGAGTVYELSPPQ